MQHGGHTQTFSGRTTLWFVILLLLCKTALTADTVTASDWTLATSDGTSIRLSEVAPQQTTVLFFWATWCPYCKALMPHLQSIRLEYGDDVRILAIDIFDDGDPVGVINEAGYEFTLLLHGDEVADEYGITGTPGIMVIDSQRNVVFDLRRLPPLPLPANIDPKNNRQKAAFLAPYWAAEIRKSIDAASQIKTP